MTGTEGISYRCENCIATTEGISYRYENWMTATRGISYRCENWMKATKGIRCRCENWTTATVGISYKHENWTTVTVTVLCFSEHFKKNNIKKKKSYCVDVPFGHLLQLFWPLFGWNCPAAHPLQNVAFAQHPSCEQQPHSLRPVF